MSARTRTLPVADFYWHAAGPGARLDPVQAAESPQRLEGQFALHVMTDGEHLLVRDPLGVNKLFFSVRPDGSVESSNFIIDLVERGIPLGAIWSVPSGHAVRIATAERRYALSSYASLDFNDAAADADALRVAAGRIAQALERTFTALAVRLAGRPIYITLSGGLDSSTIAVLARRYLPDVSGVTFCIADESGRVLESEDLRFARRLADQLDMPLQIISATPQQIVALLDEVLLYGQDWRDFNVHCGLVNAAIAAALGAAAGGSPRPVVLSGDGMNEIMSDYTPVHYAGREYYTLPKLSRAQLRQFLVRGLDTGDREVGIYNHHGVDAIQPYTICAAAYLGVPGAFLDSADAKEQLVHAVMGDAVPEYIRRRPKVRAQAGGADELRGTLNILVDAGYDEARLKQRFAELLRANAADLDGLIRAGMYRFATRWPQ